MRPIELVLIEQLNHVMINIVTQQNLLRSVQVSAGDVISWESNAYDAADQIFFDDRVFGWTTYVLRI